jgi:hypothetical protein
VGQNPTDYAQAMTVQDAYNHWSDTYDADRNVMRDLDHAVLARTVGDLTAAEKEIKP